MLPIGHLLQNRYRVLSLLGQGGMGRVYRAWDTRLNVAVAIKEMVPQPGIPPAVLAALRRQFWQEAQVLARLRHPHLVRVTDYFEEGGNAYLVMEFVEGESLAARIARQGPLPEAQVLAWAAQLLDALAYCHAHGVIHRDIKPQNIIIQPDGQAVLVDFGLVKLWDPNDPRTQTALHALGTPEYAPPEQYDPAAGFTDPRSDLYSLGATLYCALTGVSPPPAAVRVADPDRPLPASPATVRVSPRTWAAVMRAMDLARSQRFGSAAEMAAALRGKGGPPKGPAVGRPRSKGLFPARLRTPWLWGGIGVGLVLILAALGLLLALVGEGGRDGSITPTAFAGTSTAPMGINEPPGPSPTPNLAPAPASPEGPSAATPIRRPTATLVPTPLPPSPASRPPRLPRRQRLRCRPRHPRRPRRKTKSGQRPRSDRICFLAGDVNRPVKPGLFGANCMERGEGSSPVHEKPVFCPFTGNLQ